MELMGHPDRELPSNKPMHQTGALVLKECIVFVRSLVPCDDPHAGRSLRGRLQVMGRSVRRQPAARVDLGIGRMAGI